MATVQDDYRILSVAVNTTTSQWEAFCWKCTLLAENAREETLGLDDMSYNSCLNILFLPKTKYITYRYILLSSNQRDSCNSQQWVLSGFLRSAAHVEWSLSSCILNNLKIKWKILFEDYNKNTVYPNINDIPSFYTTCEKISMYLKIVFFKAQGAACNSELTGNHGCLTKSWEKQMQLLMRMNIACNCT